MWANIIRTDWPIIKHDQGWPTNHRQTWSGLTDQSSDPCLPVERINPSNYFLNQQVNSANHMASVGNKDHLPLTLQIETKGPRVIMVRNCHLSRSISENDRRGMYRRAAGKYRGIGTGGRRAPRPPPPPPQHTQILKDFKRLPKKITCKVHSKQCIAPMSMLEVGDSRNQRVNSSNTQVKM